MTELERLARLEQWKEDFVKYFNEKINKIDTSLARIESKIDKSNGNGKRLFKFGSKNVTTSQVFILWNRLIISLITALLAYLGIHFS